MPTVACQEDKSGGLYFFQDKSISVDYFEPGIWNVMFGLMEFWPSKVKLWVDEMG